MRLFPHFLRLPGSAGLAVLLSLSAGCSQSTHAYLITDRGAVGDGTQVNTHTLQKAIDDCSAAGGGVIVVPAGVFVSGALYFKPGVNLLLQKGAVLKSTTALSDFPPIYTNWEGTERYWTSAFLNFVGMTKVMVSGEGTIDGSGLDWPGQPKGPRRPGARPAPVQMATSAPAVAALPSVKEAYPGRLPTTDQISFAADPAKLPPFNAAGISLPGAGGRLSPPRALVFQDCTNVKITGVHLINPARWGIVFIYCRGVEAKGLTVKAESYIPSSDGMDVCSCQDVKIADCSISCYDDDISIKAGKDADGMRVNRPSERITISDCAFGSGGGVAMGSEVTGSIRHVVVERCSFTGTGVAARIKSQPSRGGVVEDIVFRDLQLKDVSRAIEFDTAWRMVPPLAPAAKVLTQVHNIKLINLNGTAQSGGIIRGYNESPIRALSFEHCAIVAQRPLEVANVDQSDFSGLRVTQSDGTLLATAEVK